MKILIPQGEGISAQNTSASCTASDDTTAIATSSSDVTSNVLSLTTTTNGMYVRIVYVYVTGPAKINHLSAIYT